LINNLFLIFQSIIIVELNIDLLVWIFFILKILFIEFFFIDLKNSFLKNYFIQNEINILIFYSIRLITILIFFRFLFEKFTLV
jgi:hypothetical protein